MGHVRADDGEQEKPLVLKVGCNQKRPRRRNPHAGERCRGEVISPAEEKRD